MISEQTIREAVERIVTAARPSRVIVFGSHARGDSDEGSDLDLLVIEPALVDRFQEMIRLRDAVGPIGRGVDVLVYSEEEARRRGQVPGTVIYWALKEGRVVYDAASG
jgi:predicted nucleotidyltransferase